MSIVALGMTQVNSTVLAGKTETQTQTRRAKSQKRTGEVTAGCSHTYGPDQAVDDTPVRTLSLPSQRSSSHRFSNIYYTCLGGMGRVRDQRVHGPGSIDYAIATTLSTLLIPSFPFMMEEQEKQ